VVPEIEARVDLEEVKPSVRGALEVELGDTAQIELLRRGTALHPHVRRVGNFQRR
jgi:hypothetical protein